jgi:hypothetical protein
MRGVGASRCLAGERGLSSFGPAASSSELVPSSVEPATLFVGTAPVGLAVTGPMSSGTTAMHNTTKESEPTTGATHGVQRQAKKRASVGRGSIMKRPF